MALASSTQRIETTIVVAVFALVVLGVTSSTVGGVHPARPTIRIVIGGLAAMAFTMAVGHFVGTAIA